jgi:large subunit ribosomal protein L25
MDIIKISADRREEQGKGGARRVRNQGKIPAIAYGKELEAQRLAVSPAALKQVLGSQHGQNSVVELEVSGQGKLTAMLRDYQYHPVTREFLHADFQQIRLDQEVDVEVTLELTGKPAGVVLGGVLRQVFRKLPLRCVPEKIPVKLSHDVTALGIDDHVQVRDLALPEGVKVRLPPERTLVAVVKEKQAPEEETATPGAASTGATVPPAAGGKAEPAGAEKK